jgi:hypothetical protein
MQFVRFECANAVFGFFDDRRQVLTRVTGNLFAEMM